MDEFDVSRFPHLTERLGKARTARIRYAHKGTGKRQPAATNIQNPILQQMQTIELGRGHAVEDILYGLSHSTDSDRPLGVGSLFAILQCMTTINSREIGIMFDISERQARKYMKVIKTAIPFIQRTLNLKEAA